MKKPVKKTAKKAVRKTPPVAVLPRTRQTSAVGILKDVVKVIREEPLRYNQGDWIRTTDERSVGPACGTIGCVAGWVAVLTRPAKDVTGASVALADVASRARKALGLSERQADFLFGSELPGDGGYADPGSRAYMEAGVEHIESFMRSELGYKGPKL